MYFVPTYIWGIKYARGKLYGSPTSSDNFAILTTEFASNVKSFRFQSCSSTVTNNANSKHAGSLLLRPVTKILQWFINTLRQPDCRCSAWSNTLLFASQMCQQFVFSGLESYGLTNCNHIWVHFPQMCAVAHDPCHDSIWLMPHEFVKRWKRLKSVSKFVT